MPFSIGLGTILEGVGLATQLFGSFQQSEALEDQAGGIEDLSVEEQAFIREQARIEAGLIELQGADEAEVLAFNEGVAQSNAAWERRAGEVAFSQAQKRWEAHVSSAVAKFAASGARLTGTTNDVILEQIGEMEEDLFLLGLNAERAALQEEDRGRLFSLQRRQVEARTKRQKEARIQIGEIEGETAGTEAAARARAARTGAQTAQIGGFAGLFKGGASLLAKTVN